MPGSPINELKMYPANTEQIIRLSIIVIAALVFLFLLAVTVRRLKRSAYFKKLDLARERYGLMLLPSITHALPIPDECRGKKRFSVEWQVIESVLFDAMEKGAAPVNVITEIFDRLGYIDTYIHRLQSGNRFQRAMAAEKLGRLHASRATADLIKAVNDPVREVRIVAARALGIVKSDQALQSLTELLVPGSEDPGYVSLRVVKTAIRKYGEEAIPHLIPLLGHPSWRVRSQAVDLIGEAGGMASAERLISLLEDTEPDVRAKAAKALGRIKTPGAIRPLVGRLKDPWWVVRLHAAKTLGRLGGGEAVYPLLELLLDSNWQVRSAAANSLRRMGNFVIPALIKMLLQTGDRYAREQIVEELQRTDILERQIDRLGSKEARVREGASLLLVAAGNSGAIGVITRAVKGNPDPGIRMRLIHILSLIEHPLSLKTLQEAAEGDENEAVRYSAGMVLERRGEHDVKESGGAPF